MVGVSQRSSVLSSMRKKKFQGAAKASTKLDRVTGTRQGLGVGFEFAVNRKALNDIQKTPAVYSCTFFFFLALFPVL